MRKLLPILLLGLALAAGTWLGYLHGTEPQIAGPQMKLHFIDVGQGDSILIQSPDAKNMLVDAGEQEAGEKVVSYLKSHGVKRLEFLVMTHPHSDHIGGVPAVIENLRVSYVLDSGYPHGSSLQERVLRQIDEKKIPYLIAYAGQQYRLGRKVRIEILSPPRRLFRGTESDANNNSVVMRITYGAASALLAGDMQHEAESVLLSSHKNIESNILKVAHHGSRDSTSIEFLRQVKPGFVVISVGAHNEYGHPHRSTLRRLSPERLGAQLFRTDKDGTVLIFTDGRTIRAETER